MAPTVLTEGQHREEYLISEGNGDISRESGYVLTAGNSVKDGRLLALVGGKLVPTTGANSGGNSTETIIGFASGDVDATDADKPIVVIARLAEVKDALVVLHTVSGGGAAAATAAILKALEAKNLILRKTL